MAFLTRRKPWDETLPDGRNVYEAVRDLSRHRDEHPVETTILPPINTPLMRQPIETPAAIVPSEPDYAPVLSRPQPVLSQMAPPPVMMLERGGHAVSATGGIDPLEADQTLLRTQQAEIPQRESKKQVLLRTLGGLVFGGVPGAIGTLATDLSDRRALDRGRINQNIARTQGQINQGILSRRAATQDDLIRSQIQENQAQAYGALSRANQPPKSDSKFIERGDGVYEVSTAYPDGRKVGSIPPEAKTKNANPTRYFERPEGVYGINDAHPEGFKVEGVPGTPVPSLTPYQTEQLNREDAIRGSKGEALRQQSASARSLGDALDKQLRDAGGLYEQRAQVQTALGREGDVTTPEQRVAHSTLMTQLSALNSRIAQIEQGRNIHYSQADKLRGQAAEFNSLPQTRGSKYVAPKVSADRLRELMQ